MRGIEHARGSIVTAIGVERPRSRGTPASSALRDRLGPPLLIALASTAAVFHNIGFSAWVDETFSYGIATQSFRTLIGHWIWGSEANMALYYLLLKAWLGVTGLLGIQPNEIILRLPSSLAAVGASVMIFLIGRRLFGTVAGTVAAGLYLANFLQIIVAQMARSYSLELLLLGVSWYALLAALDAERRSARWWLVYVAATTLAIYAALFSALVLASQLAALIILLLLPNPWRERVRRSTRPAALSLLAVFILSIPIGVDALIHGGPTWVPVADRHQLAAFFLFIGGGSRRYELAIFGLAALGFLLALNASWPRPHSLGRISGARVDAAAGALAMAAWFIVPLAISFALTQPRLNLHLFFHRYLVVVVPPLCLLVGLAVGAVRWRIAQLGLGVGLAIIALPQLLHYYPFAEVQNFRDPVQWVEQRYQAGDGLICEPAVQCAIPVDYYLQMYRGPAHYEADSPGRFLWDTSRQIPLDDASVRNYAARHQRIFVVFGPLGRVTELVDQDQHLKAQLADRFVAIGSITGHGSTVDETATLYQVKP